MEIENFTFEKATELLHNIYVSDEYNQLMTKCFQTTYLEAMGKQRSETIFSSLLAWVFSNPDFDKTRFDAPAPQRQGFALPLDSPVLFLVRLLVRKAVRQGNGNGELMDNTLCDKILTNDIVVKVNSVRTEVQTFDKNENGRIDLIIDCSVKSRNDPAYMKRLRLLVENKVDSEEHSDQCKKYYDYFSNKNSKDYNEDIDVYVFLSIDEPEKLSCNRFVKITYQELLDSVLTLVMMQDKCYPETSVRYLQDFIDTITSLKTDNRRNIAMDSKTRKLLKDFYENNKDLIAAAVLAGSDDDELIEEMKKSQKRDTSRYKLSYNGLLANNLAKANVAFEAVKMLRDSGMSPSDIETALNGIGSFWEKAEAGKNPTSGYTAEVKFGNGETYLVHTQRYKTDIFKKLVDKLVELGFSCEQA